MEGPKKKRQAENEMKTHVANIQRNMCVCVWDFFLFFAPLSSGCFRYQ